MSPRGPRYLNKSELLASESRVLVARANSDDRISRLVTI
jgi:hypothetical protein